MAPTTEHNTICCLPKQKPIDTRYGRQNIKAAVASTYLSRSHTTHFFSVKTQIRIDSEKNIKKAIKNKKSLQDENNKMTKMKDEI